MGNAELNPLRNNLGNTLKFKAFVGMDRWVAK
jgi:hypothetical protein